MNYRDSIITLVQQPVEAMTFPVTIDNIVANGNDYTLTCCDVYHAQPGFIVTIDGQQYTIVSVTYPGTLVVRDLTGTNPITAESFDMYTPFFFHGTPIETNVELGQVKDAAEKTPMVWFLENFSEKFNDNEEETLERESTCRIFFLTQADHNKWLTDDFYSNAILPMHRLLENWIADLKENKRFETQDLEYTTTNHIKFGVYIANKGVQSSLFSDKLSGVECAIVLKTYKPGECPDC